MGSGEFLRLVARAYVCNEAYVKQSSDSSGGSSDISFKGMPFEGTTFVFPNRRSLKFFQKYLGEEFGKRFSMPLFSPDMVTISELFSSIGSLEIVDPIEAQYVLYRNYLSLKYDREPLEKAMEYESFDEFLHWCNIVIADFNDVDKYLIDAGQLFTNIRDLKQLDSDYSFLSENQRAAVEMFWSSYLRGGENFKKESFSSLWGIMHRLYINFREELLRGGKGYEGMIYRKVAENPQACDFEKLVFIGFNAPNRCEKVLMKWLKEQGRADFYWDFYGPMVTDRENKASMFINEAVREFPSKYQIVSECPMPEINVVGIPSGVGQTFVAADVLKSLSGEDPFKTAVVLPDETLLMPLLNSIPEEFNKVNVTMGFPVSATPLTGFVRSVAALQKSIKEKNGVKSFYHRSVIDLLKHSYIKEHYADVAARIISDIVKGNHIYIAHDSEILRGMEPGLMAAIFRMPEDSLQVLIYLEEVLKELDLVSSVLDKEFIYRYYLGIERLRELAIPMRKETCLRLLDQITSSITIPFQGEPLAGLQVMGSLEVRALDFDNVIILSVNEGCFPGSSQSNSIIPYNLRVGFGLPTYELQDAIAAYHFYRSIYRAKRVWLIYDTRTEGLKSGEESRFIKQLEYHYEVELNKSVVSAAPVIDKEERRIEVVKDEALMQMMYESYVDDGGAKSLSASAINSYITCPLQFYLQYIRGIKEEDEIHESIEASTFGTIFHDTMEELYSKYKGEVVSVEIIDSIIKDKATIERIILEKFKKNRIKEIVGSNVIIKEVIRKYVLITLEEDKKYAPFNYLASEERFQYKLKLPNGYGVRFSAVVDRMDSTESSLRVIDYKTGKVEVPSGKCTIEDFFKNDSQKHYHAFVQLYLYALILDGLADEKGMLKLRSGKSTRIVCSEESTQFDLVIYPVTSLMKQSVVCEPIYRSKLESYKAALVDCVSEIFNKDIPFRQAEEGDAACGYCMFKEICGR